MAPKIFLTGATGYIGGDILYTITRTHPGAKISALIRTEEKASNVRKAYPDLRVVLGSLDDSSILQKEAGDADVVIHTADASDHVGAAKAIAKGLVEGHSKEKPGYWLHTGGTGILTYFDSEAKSFGEHTDKVFDDYDGVKELTTLPAAAFHRNVDEIVLNCGTDHGDVVKTALVCPPSIYGVGRGPSLIRGRQIYELTTFILQQQYSPQIGKGLAIWNNIHVHDLSEIYSLLLNAALSPRQTTADPAELWGEKGYYFTENGEHVWGELSAFIGKEAAKQGLVPDDIKTDSLSYDEAVKSPAGFEAASWGMNSRGKAIRARKILGWVPKASSLNEEVPQIVRAENERLKGKT